MLSIKKEMSKIKVDSYKDCVWYIKDLDKCKLPSAKGEQFSKCLCKNKDMLNFCVWVTKFLKSGPKSYEDLSDVKLPDSFFGGIQKPTTEIITIDGDISQSLLKILEGLAY